MARPSRPAVLFASSRSDMLITDQDVQDARLIAVGMLETEPEVAWLLRVPADAGIRDLGVEQGRDRLSCTQRT